MQPTKKLGLDGHKSISYFNFLELCLHLRKHPFIFYALQFYSKVISGLNKSALNLPSSNSIPHLIQEDFIGVNQALNVF